MRRLFTEGIGHNKFQTVKIRGRVLKIPEEWKIKRLKEILKLEYGKGLKKSDRKCGNFPVLGSNGIIDYHKEFLIKGPGIVVGRKGSIGKVTWVEKNYWPIDTSYYVKPLDEDLPLKWFYYALDYLNLPRLKLHDVVPGLNRDYAYSQKIMLPKLGEMKKIQSILENMDNKINNELFLMEKFKKIKHGLMQVLLTGKKQVPA